MVLFCAFEMVVDKGTSVSSGVAFVERNQGQREAFFSWLNVPLPEESLWLKDGLLCLCVVGWFVLFNKIAHCL